MTSSSLPNGGTSAAAVMNSGGSSYSHVHGILQHYQGQKALIMQDHHQHLNSIIVQDIIKIQDQEAHLSGITVTNMSEDGWLRHLPCCSA